MNGKSETLVDKAFTGSGQSGSFYPYGRFQVLLKGGVGTVKLQKNDATLGWITVSRDSAGTEASWALSSNAMAFNCEEWVPGSEYRFDCTYTSGTVNSKAVRDANQ